LQGEFTRRSRLSGKPLGGQESESHSELVEFVREDLEMGLDAQVIAVGPYSSALASALEYPTEYYANVRDGDTVTTCVFEALTSEQSHKLAEAFGVGAMDLGKHHLSPGIADLAALRAVFEDEPVENFLLLFQHGFDFYYRPNA
jgi:hypothetical protein